MQVVPKRFIPYFTLIGREQTINESSYFGEYFVKSYTIAAEKVGNTVLLNHSTDGVSCENIWNIHTIMKYFEGNSRFGPAQDVHFFYTRSHLSALQICTLIFSTNFHLIFTFK